MSTPQSYIRTDVLTGRQVIVATGRDSRPIHVGMQSATSENSVDPFLQGNEHSTPRESLALRRCDSTADESGWLLRVVPNRYPAVGPVLNVQPDTSAVFPEHAATGIHEVVIECPDSQTRLADMSVAAVARVLLAWQKRLQQLSLRFNVINIFRNEGFEAGASLPHCHSQILAVNEQSSALKLRLAAAQKYREVNGVDAGSLFERWRNAEIQQQHRVVKNSDDFVLVCPFASRFPWQLRICPARDQAADFSLLNVQQLVDLAADLLTSCKSLSQVRPLVSFNLTLTLPPADQPEAFPWMLDLMPRPNKFAGFEIMTDVEINTVSPESAAGVYREMAADLPLCPASEICPDGYEWREQV